ncbi:MAG TPA: beta/gamma crystallin-related protein [Ramlibacter sp.]|nr:beta/gamma crystallin-related protein [Ramlibacter sp.]
MNPKLKTALAASALLLAAHASAQITFYNGEGFRGRAFTADHAVPNFNRSNLNDRISSVVVDQGRWEVCEHANFRGRCVVLRRGSYDSLAKLGMENAISSARPTDRRRQYDNEVQAQMETPNYAYRRRANERVYEAPVTAVHAVMGPPTQHCWIERQQVSEPARDRNVGGAIAGALIGGVLGHQVGGGSGKDIATVGGAVAGGVIGSNMGRGGATTASRDVQRCDKAVSGTPAYWDVTYNFRGRDHQLQMSAAPGTTIAVNRDGEPRQ